MTEVVQPNNVVAETTSNQETPGQSIRSTSALTLDRDSMQSMMMFADVMARGVATVPQHLRGNASDCLAVLMQSMQWRMNPYAVAQKTHLVSGTLGYEAQLVNAVIISLAPTKDRLHFEWTGTWEKIVGKFKEVTSGTKKDDNGQPKKYRVPAWDLKDEDGLKVRVWATLKGETDPRELTLMMTQARTRNSTLWADDPKQQLAYLAIKRWSRLYTPDVIMGVYTPDELEETLPVEKDITPRTAGQFAERAAAPAAGSSETRDRYVKQLEAASALGMDALVEKFSAIGKDGRKLVGAAEWDRIKGTVPPVEAPAAAETAATPSGPTYAELMERVKEAKDDDELSQVMSDSAALPDDQQSEILAACKVRSEGLANV